MVFFRFARLGWFVLLRPLDLFFFLASLVLIDLFGFAHSDWLVQVRSLGLVRLSWFVWVGSFEFARLGYGFLWLNSIEFVCLGSLVRIGLFGYVHCFCCMQLLKLL